MDVTGYQEGPSSVPSPGQIREMTTQDNLVQRYRLSPGDERGVQKGLQKRNQSVNRHNYMGPSGPGGDPTGGQMGPGGRGTNVYYSGGLRTQQQAEYYSTVVNRQDPRLLRQQQARGRRQARSQKRQMTIEQRFAKNAGRNLDTYLEMERAQQQRRARQQTPPQPPQSTPQQPQ